MARLEWDRIDERFFEVGVDRGVLFMPGKNGIPWNGLVSVDANHSSSFHTPAYMDGVKLNARAFASDFSARIQAFTYPEEFAQCDGTSWMDNGIYVDEQRPSDFAICYRTKYGSAVAGQDRAYKLHIVYNAVVTPTSRDNVTVGTSLDPMLFNWDISTFGVPMAGFRPSAHFIIDSSRMSELALKRIEEILYGYPGHPSRLLTPDELRYYASADYWIFENDQIADYNPILLEGNDLVGNEESGIYEVTGSSKLKDGEIDGYYER